MLSEAEFKVLRALAGATGAAPVANVASAASAAVPAAAVPAPLAAAAPTAAAPATSATQRAIAELAGLSLGSVNRHLRGLRERGLVAVAADNATAPPDAPAAADAAPPAAADAAPPATASAPAAPAAANPTATPTLTPAGLQALAFHRVDNAIILAAGFGSRFVPYTYETPKGLLTVKGTPMVERQIEQLLAVGISDITLVVGYKKEMFDYLIDKYGVRLLFNPEYAVKNNFVSLYYARERLANSYVLVSDDWIEQSIFNTYEYDSWICGVYYDGPTDEWVPVTGAHDRILSLSIGGQDDFGLIGPAYFSRAYSEQFSRLLEHYYERPGTDDFYFEHIIHDNLKELPIRLNRQSAQNVHEFETLAELRDYDESYREDAHSAVMQQIAAIFKVRQSEIEITGPLKEGMTNNSFLFAVAGQSFVFRLPGQGTDKLIDRAREKWAYEMVAPLDLADEIIFFDGKSGIKVSRFYEGARVADPTNDAEVAEVMCLLRRIHQADLRNVEEDAPADRRFDVAREIAFYEELASELEAIRYSDYEAVRTWADELLALRERLDAPEVLCHIDYVYTNILYLPDGLRVIDWEYAGFADPIIDVAMFAIYAYYSREQADRALLHYLGRQPTRLEETRLYLYMALCGLLWSLWTEYKQGLGDEFGDYSLTQYRYMKDFYRILSKEGYLAEAGAAAGALSSAKAAPAKTTEAGQTGKG
jgi:CTP:phosphocholine cytidylyltransferase-like protein/thiamine kinase-like enzyme